MIHGITLLRCVLIVLLIVLAEPANASEPTHLHVLDYFLMLPRGNGFEAEPSVLLDIMREDHDLIDQKNGYMQCGGNGAQVGFEVALFRFRDGRPLIAVCFEDFLSGAHSLYLKFFVLGVDRRMQPAPRTMFPVEDGGGRQFILPRFGKTVIVRGEADKRETRFTWDGAQFIADK